MSDILFCPQYPEIARASAHSVSTEESWNVGDSLECGGMGSVAIVGDILETKVLEPEWKASLTHRVAQLKWA